MFNTILVPLDGSKRSEAIFPYVEKLALRFDSKVVFLQVVQADYAYTSPPNYYNNIALEEANMETLKREAKIYLSSLQGEFREKGIDARFIVTEGPVVQMIINMAEREGADLIAMASHGRTGLARVFYGSVAAGVLHQIDRPLLMIRSEGTG